MIVNTSRFGQVQVDAEQTLTFPKGLLGFPKYTRYVLIQPSEDSFFYWMQSMQAADLAFVVTDPSLFVPTYRVPFKQEQMVELGITGPEDAYVLVIVNKHGHLLTGNLQGPLVIHASRRIGEQLVLSDRRFTTRVPLLELPVAAEAVAV
jgi:flagellar assembly factor FliW